VELQDIAQAAAPVRPDVAERQAATVHAPHDPWSRDAKNGRGLLGGQLIVPAQPGDALGVNQFGQDVADDGDCRIRHADAFARAVSMHDAGR